MAKIILVDPVVLVLELELDLGTRSACVQKSLSNFNLVAIQFKNPN